MAQGTERREGTPDSLVGAAEITPVLTQAPALQVANASVPNLMESTSARLARSVNTWASGKLQDAANVQHEASVLDGQMAYQQGVAMDQMETPGDKWAMQGYRVMEAETLSATMMTAQRTMIQQSQYEQDPDQFRAAYINRLNQQIDGLDPQTAKMVRENMAEQMPTLVAEHTGAYMQNEEQKLYDSVVASIGAMSQDPTALQNMLSNAVGGEGSATAGLSSDRLRNATVNGVISALNSDNPLAFQQMSDAGLLEELPDAEAQALRAADDSYRQRRNSEYSEAWTQDMSDYNRMVDAGDFASGADALDSLTALYAKHDRRLSQAVAGNNYTAGENASDINDRIDNTRARTNIQAAQNRGDYRSVAAQTVDIIEFIESGGDVNAIGPVVEGGANAGDQAQGNMQVMPKTLADPGYQIRPVVTGGANAGDRAEGNMQVMPKTLADPGYGIRPSNGTREDNSRVGREYWTQMVKMFPNDLEAAAIAYNGGPGTANTFIASGRNYDALPDPEQSRGYAQKFMDHLNGDDLYYTASEQLGQATTELQTAQRLRTEIMDQQNVEAESQYNVSRLLLTDRLDNGDMNSQEFVAAARLMREGFGLQATLANNTRDNSTIKQALADRRSAYESAEAEGEKSAEAESLFQLEYAFGVASDMYEQVAANPDATLLEVDTAFGVLQQSMQVMSAEAGVELRDSKFLTTLNAARTTYDNSRERIQERNDRDDLIRHNVNNGTVATLSKGDQEEAHLQMNAALEQNIRQNGQRNPHQTQSDENAMRANGTLGNWLQAGSVPADIQAQASAAMNGQAMIDGEVNQQQVAILDKWNALRSESPAVAATMLDEPGRLRAQLILAQSGGSFQGPASIEAAIRAEADGVAVRSGGIVKDIAEQSSVFQGAIDMFTGEENFGFFQAIFNGNLDVADADSALTADSRAAFNDGGQARLNGLMEAEMERLNELRPHADPMDLRDEAARLVVDRTTVIGSNMLTVPHNQPTVAQSFFGDRAGEYTKPGIENTVVQHHLRSLFNSDPEKYGYLYDTEFMERAGAFNRGVRAVGDAAATLFGAPDFVARPQMSMFDAASIESGEHTRPLESTMVNGQLIVRSILPDGSIAQLPIVIPMQEAGAAFMEFDKQDMLTNSLESRWNNRNDLSARWTERMGQ